jgi:Lipase (class 3)
MHLNALNLDLEAKGFSLHNAMALASASEAAYYQVNRPGIQSKFCHVLLLPQEDCIVVAFRGTKRLADILIDAEAERVHLPFTAGSVHAGFWKSVNSVAADLIEALRPDGDLPELPLFITGHSKGGAEAMLFAYLLEHKLRPARIAGVYTFDQPRIFDAGARASYNAILHAATWRIVNGGDIVPQVPFWHWGYRHAGNEVFLPDPSYPVDGPLVNPAWDITAVSKLDAYWRALRTGRDVLLADHFITDIQKRLAAAMRLQTQALAAERQRQQSLREIINQADSGKR